MFGGVHGQSAAVSAGREDNEEADADLYAVDAEDVPDHYTQKLAER